MKNKEHLSEVFSEATKFDINLQDLFLLEIEDRLDFVFQLLKKERKNYFKLIPFQNERDIIKVLVVYLCKELETTQSKDVAHFADIIYKSAFDRFLKLHSENTTVSLKESLDKEGKMIIDVDKGIFSRLQAMAGLLINSDKLYYMISDTISHDRLLRSIIRYLRDERVQDNMVSVQLTNTNKVQYVANIRISLFDICKKRYSPTILIGDLEESFQDLTVYLTDIFRRHKSVEITSIMSSLVYLSCGAEIDTLIMERMFKNLLKMIKTIADENGTEIFFSTVMDVPYMDFELSKRYSKLLNEIIPNQLQWYNIIMEEDVYLTKEIKDIINGITEENFVIQISSL